MAKLLACTIALALISGTAAAAAPLAAAAAAADVQPALDLIQRNFGEAAVSAFNLTISNSTCEGGGGSSSAHGCFALSEQGGKVVIAASSIAELTYGIGYYTRFSCGLTVGWKRGGGSHTEAKAWPCHTAGTLQPAMVPRSVPYTYEDNVCTHSYSYVWYGEAEWTAHIDWMALQGVNVFLAMTGQEEVQYKAFRKFGMGDREIREFFNGPAFLTWSRGQSMQSVGASALPEGGSSGLPRSWMQAQWRLQKFILSRTRPLGIIGVLPAFQGNLPPQIKTLQPTANISVTRHSDGYNDTKGQCAWLAASDPLFGRIAAAWMEIMLADFGTDHWYQCDGFFTGAKPPWYMDMDMDDTDTVADEDDDHDDHDVLAAAAKGAAAGGGVAPPPPPPPIDPKKVVADPNWLPVWKGAWEGMATTDPDAKWLYQGWAIRGWTDNAGASRLKALYESVPHGQWVPLDMDIAGIWKYWGNYSFFGAPFIWTTIHNMGGNDGACMRKNKQTNAAFYEAVCHESPQLPSQAREKHNQSSAKTVRRFAAVFPFTFFHASLMHATRKHTGMKGDMRMLADLPGAAMAAGASIIGTGATPEGIDQNPPYCE
jgi:alpha-N-acetylglucosaminidase